MEFITVADTAGLLRIAEHQRIRASSLPTMTMGNPWRIERRTLETWLTRGGDRHTDNTQGDKT